MSDSESRKIVHGKRGRRRSLSATRSPSPPRHRKSKLAPAPPPSLMSLELSPMLTGQQIEQAIQIKEQIIKLGKVIQINEEIIQSLELSCEAKFDQINGLEALVQTKNNELSSSNQLIRSLRKDIENLNATVKSKDKKIQDLEHVAQIKKRPQPQSVGIEVKRTKIRPLVKKLKTLQKELDEKQLKIKLNESDEKFFKSKIEKLQIGLKEKKSEIHQLQLELKESNFDSSLKLENLQLQHERKDSEIESLKCDVKYLAQKLADKQLEIDEIKPKFNFEKQLEESEIGASTSPTSSLHEFSKSFKKQVVEFFQNQREEIQNVEYETSTCVQEISNLKAKVEEYEEIIDSIQEKLTKVQFYKKQYKEIQDRFEWFTKSLGGEIGDQVIQNHLQKLNELRIVRVSKDSNLM